MKVLIVDDNELTRDTLAASLAKDDIDVVGHAASLAEAIAAVDRSGPDVVILDIQLSGSHSDISGLAAARQLRAARPQIGLLILSAHDEPIYAERLIGLDENGPRAVGYLVKHRGGLTALVDAVRRVAGGGVVIDADLARRLVLRRQADLRARVTPADWDMLALVTEGLSNQGIAERTHHKLSTIEQRLTDITRRLGLPGLDDPERRTSNVRVLAVLAYLSENPGRHPEWRPPQQGQP